MPPKAHASTTPWVFGYIQEISWPKGPRLDDTGMKRLRIDVLNRTYAFIHRPSDEDTYSKLLVRLVERDPILR